MTNTIQIPERFRQTMRYRRRYLQNRRTHLFNKAAQEIREKGKPQGTTNFKIRNTERQIEEFNCLAQEWGLPTIRT